jgi:predicted permease
MPDWTSDLRTRLAPLALAPIREAEIIEELAAHLDERFEELCLVHSPGEARRLALGELDEDEGQLAARLRALREIRRPAAALPAPGAARTRLLGDLWQDLRYAARMLAAMPGFTLAAVLTLALGIGANTAVFSLINTTLLARLPVADADELHVAGRGGFGSVFSYPAYVDLRDRNDVFTDLMAFGGITASLNADAETDLVSGVIVTGNYFQVLGVDAAIGRALTPEDDEVVMGHPVVVIGHELWQQRFGGRSDIVGTQVLLNGHRFTIVGVTPAGFRGAQIGIARQFYVPMMMQPLMRPPRAGYAGEMDPNLLGHRGNSWLFPVGRLKPGVTPEQAEASLTALAQSIAATLPGAAARPASARPEVVTLTPLVLGDPRSRSQITSAAWLLAGVVGAVLLIACANVANLLLSRAAARRSEIALRLALGAGRGRLVRQLLTESVLLSFAGGAGGLAVATGLGAAFRAAPPPAGALPLALDFSIDARVLAFTLGLSLGTGLIFGLAPALGASRPGLLPALKSRDVDERGRRAGARQTLVVAQVAISLALLVAAGLFVRSLQRAQAIDPGFDATRLVTARLDVNLLRYTTAQGRDFYNRVIESVEALPGVESASVARMGLLPGGGRIVSLHVEGRGGSDNAMTSEGDGAIAVQPEVSAANVVGPRYFDTLGIPLLRGRDFGDGDTASSPPVAVVNEALARREFQGADPIGRRISVQGSDGPWIEIVGVASDTKYADIGEPPTPIVYVPMAQNHETGVFLLVRAAAREPDGLVAPIRQAIQTLEPNLPITGIELGRDRVGASLYPARMGAWLLSAFGLLALTLAGVGVYGVLAFSIARRRREMGIRLALGADASRIVRLVVGEGMTLVAFGLGIGLTVALSGARALESFLYGAGAYDPITFAVVPVLLVLVALAACLVPARRAVAVDPTVTLRSE